MNRLFITLLSALILTGCASTSTCKYDNRIATAIVSAQLYEPCEGPQLICRPLTNEEKIQNELKGKDPIYTFEISGLCPGDQYALFSVNAAGGVMHLGDFVVSDQSELCPVGGEGFNFLKVFNSMGNFMAGETVSYVLVCTNKDLTAAAVVTPNPIEASWEDGAYARIAATSKNMDIFVLSGKGFTPNETIRFTSVSWNELIDKEHTATADGKLQVRFSPHGQRKGWRNQSCHS